MNNLQRALEEQKQQTEQEVPSIPGLLGVPLSGQRRVEVSGRNAYVYVRLRSNQNEVIQAYNNQVAPAYNLPVLVERQGNKYVVIGVDTARYENNWISQSPFLPRHGNTHSFDLESGGAGDVVWVHLRQIVPALVFPSGSAGADSVIVHPYILRDDNGSWKYVGNTGTSSLAPYRPTSPTGAVMALVYLDNDSGNPYFLINSGTVFSNTLTGTSQITPFIPQTTSRSQLPLAAIRLITGTNRISWDNIYDVRQWVHAFTSGSAGGISSIAVQDEGTPQGNVTTFNFVGDLVHASISGSVARIFVTGSASGGGINTGTLDARYLKLDASNDPVTGHLDIRTSQNGGSNVHTLNVFADSSLTNGGIRIAASGSAYGMTIQVKKKPVANLYQIFNESASVSEALLYLSRYRSDGSSANNSLSPHFLIDDFPETNMGLYGGTLRHLISGSVVILGLNPQATGTVIPYIFNTQYSKPTGTIHTQWMVNGSEVARVDVSGTVYSNNSPLIKEAPVDGQAYLRKNAGWEKGVSFSAYRSSSQTIGSSSFTKVQFDTEEFDTGGFYDNATNYRFQPTVAGKYQVNACLSFPTASGIVIALLYKNGARFKDGNTLANTALGTSSTVSTLVDMNGSTDYIEIFTFQNSGGDLALTGNSNASWFQASLQI